MSDEVGRDLRFKKIRIRDESQMYRTLIILKTVWLDMKTINLTKISPYWFRALLL